jgi:signal transduction histidine kinase
MLANMNHEIRTPLTSVTGFADIMQDELDGRMGEFAGRIHKSGERLMRTLDSVLQLSKLEAGISEIDREEVDLNDLTQETAELLRPTAQEKGIALDTRLPDGPVRGMWNEGALNRIAENLIENAIKFTPSGGTVTIRVREEQAAAVLEVEDTGVGIAESAQAEIFEAFQQESEGLGREFEGSGLGLSIVKRLVEAHAGTIAVESEKGVGSRFTARFPKT